MRASISDPDAGCNRAVEKAEGNAELAAIEVCLLLENQIGLAGNGWFDDDEKTLAVFRD